MVDQSRDVEYSIAVGDAEPPRPLKPPEPPKPLTLRFGLLMIVAALGGSFVVRALVSVAASALAQLQTQNVGDWSGLGTALLGVAIGFLGGYGAAVIIALVMSRGRVSGLRFGLHFAAVYLACFVLDAAIRWLGFLSVELGDYYIETSVFVTVALPFTLPLVFSRLIRWRTVVVVAAIGVALAVAATVTQAQLATSEQADRNAAYTGPAFAPSTSPGSPVEGYSLEYVELPDGYDDYVGAVGVSLTYRKPAPDGYDDYFYVEFSADDSAMYCGGPGDDCAEVGTALGSTVFAESPIDYVVLVDDGMIALRGELDGGEVLAVLADLHHADIDELAALTTD